MRGLLKPPAETEMPVADRRYAQLMGVLAGGLVSKVIVRALQYNPLELSAETPHEGFQPAPPSQKIKLATELGIVGGLIAVGAAAGNRVAEWQHNRS